MAKKPISSGPISIKGNRFDNTIKIGEGAYAFYSPADLQRGFIIDGGGGNDTLAGAIGSVDKIIGGSGFDFIFAQEEDILAAGAAGTVAYDGGLDRDIVSFQEWTKDVGIDLGMTNIAGETDRYYTDFILTIEGVRLVPSTPDGMQDPQVRDATVNIEGVIGGKGNDLIGGDWGANYLEGGPGNDYIEGKRGDDHLVGGAGNDVIYLLENDLVSGDYSDTAPQTFPIEASGNDKFVVGGGQTGAYYRSTITDFDPRDDDQDTQFDALWISSFFQGRFDEDAAGTLKYVWGTEADGALGEVLLAGLTLADQNSVPIVVFDPMTGLP